jgi:hypothetical protein
VIIACALIAFALASIAIIAVWIKVIAPVPSSAADNAREQRLTLHTAEIPHRGARSKSFLRGEIGN